MDRVATEGVGERVDLEVEGRRVCGRRCGGGQDGEQREHARHGDLEQTNSVRKLN